VWLHPEYTVVTKTTNGIVTTLEHNDICIHEYSRAQIYHILADIMHCIKDPAMSTYPIWGALWYSIATTPSLVYQSM
jgi:hypothetical protein